MRSNKPREAGVFLKYNFANDGLLLSAKQIDSTNESNWIVLWFPFGT